MGNINYSSISEIHDALVQRDHTTRELRQYLLDNYDAYKRWVENGAPEDTATDKIRGSEMDFHNLSVEFSKQGCAMYAAEIAAMGIEAYPLSTDLIADQIKYCQKIGNKKKCQEGFDLLNRIDRKYWNWRTYVFVIDFLKDGLSSAKNVTDYEEDIKKAKAIIADFKTHIPHDERSYVAEAELHENQGEFDTAMKVLEEATEKVAVAPQCCLKLADMKLERGAYSEVEKYARTGILMATEEQPSVSVGYLYYLLALAMDANRIKSRQAGNLVEDVQIQKIVNAFHTADRLLLNEGRPNVSYRKTIKSKLIVLEMEENVFVELPIQDAKEMQENPQFSRSDLLQLKKMLEDGSF